MSDFFRDVLDKIALRNKRWSSSGHKTHVRDTFKSDDGEKILLFT